MVGTFTDGETIKAISLTRDVEVSFTVSSQINTSTITNDGILNSVSDTLTIESLGSEVSEVVVEDIKTGSIDEIIVEDVGSLYEVGDSITFTADSNGSIEWLIVAGGGSGARAPNIETGGGGAGGYRTSWDSSESSPFNTYPAALTVSVQNYNVKIFII